MLEDLLPPFREYALDLADDAYGNYTLQEAIRRFEDRLIPDVLEYADEMLLSFYSAVGPPLCLQRIPGLTIYPSSLWGQYVLREIIGHGRIYRNRILKAIGANFLVVTQRPETADVLRAWRYKSDLNERLAIAQLFLSTQRDGRPVLAELVKSVGGLQAISGRCLLCISPR